MSAEDTPVSLFLQACKQEGVKTPNPKLVEFFQSHETFDSILEIDLRNNYAGNRGLLAVLDVIGHLNCFRCLNAMDQKLYNSDLNEEAVKGNTVIDRIVEVFRAHPTANSLKLSNNPISNYAGRKLLSLAQVNSRMCLIEVNDTRIDFELRNKIAKQCEENTRNMWNAEQEVSEKPDGVFGESLAWVPTQVTADLTSLGAGRARRQTVQVAGIDPEAAKNYVAPVYEKSQEDTSMICKLLSHNVLFSFLGSKDILTVAGAMYRVELVKDECVIEFGQAHCDRLYVIQSGEADILKEGQKVFVKREGMAVGELELLYDTPAVATVKVSTETLVAWVLDRETYRNLVMGSCMRRRDTYVSMLAKVPFLQSLDIYERMQVADALTSDEFATGDYIIHYNEEGEWLYIIIEGTVEVIGRDEAGNKTKVCEFHSGDHIGELEFLNNHRTVADVVAVTDVTTAKLNRRHFEMCMGPVMDVLRRDMTSTKYEYYQHLLQQQGTVAAAQ
ncbi:protein kinase A regulatory subunit, putative [Leishmania panamensis]|uniref:Protein kinase A regulatory subunit, putative n=2 Tax=Leishmania guyanensis species complex TaxID=38579 RepID=A0A088S4M5_LEIPA|nr:protein kinase A regulatory subunit, putative [Leishmania panamensis]AIN96446.1 protein kinase A regulatory subunit, putative [Leishmania panamensis]CCM13837.1 protein kinase A regulatory subunit, putative [Leishmania guyanensis]